MPRPEIRYSAVAIALGIVLIAFTPGWQTPKGIALAVPLALWPRSLGILIIANVVSYWVVKCTCSRVMTWAELKPDRPQDYRTFVLLGFAEGTMYPLAVIGGVNEFVAVWLAFKAVSVWHGHAGGADSSEVQSPGTAEQRLFNARNRYRFYLFNNALRLALSAATYAALLFWATNGAT